MGLPTGIAYSRAVTARLQRLISALTDFARRLAPLHPGRWSAAGRARLLSALRWTGLLAAIGLALLAVVLLPPLFTPDLDDPQAQFEVRDRARLTMAAIGGAVVVLVGVYINWRRVSAMERQVTTLQLGQITERFTRAIDQLGAVRAGHEPAPEIRAGGVRSLERIARESVEDFWPVLDILTAYLRAECRWEAPYPDSSEDSPFPKGYEPVPEEILNRMDVAFTVEAVVRLWPREPEMVPTPLNLANTFVPNISLQEKYLRGANLEGAGLYLAVLAGADLRGANLRGAFLRRTNLRGADLRGADFWGAILEAARLQGADLRGAFLLGADLRGASLEGADLRGADLTRANFEGARHDSRTQWPRGFAPPDTGEVAGRT